MHSPLLFETVDSCGRPHLGPLPPKRPPLRLWLLPDFDLKLKRPPPCMLMNRLELQVDPACETDDASEAHRSAEAAQALAFMLVRTKLLRWPTGAALPLAAALGLPLAVMPVQAGSAACRLAAGWLAPTAADAAVPATSDGAALFLALCAVEQSVSAASMDVVFYHVV